MPPSAHTVRGRSSLTGFTGAYPCKNRDKLEDLWENMWDCKIGSGLELSLFKLILH